MVRNLNVHSAEDMMVATLCWRDEFKVQEVLKEEFPAEVFGNLGHVYGKDKEGRPVMLVHGSSSFLFPCSGLIYCPATIYMAAIKISRLFLETSIGSSGR